MSEKVYNTFKLQDTEKFAAVVEEMNKDELVELQTILKKKVSDMVFDPSAVLKLSIVETKLERMSDGKIN